MAALPENRNTLVEAIDRAFVAQADTTPRAHLGASVLGRECEREIWYGFRWAQTENRFDGRMLRLFDRGQREEAWFERLLALAGCQVQTHDSQGKQFSFIEAGLGGHFRGSMDGIACGVPEAPKAWHVLEFKTHNDKSFQKLCKEGVREAKPEHFDQMQVYMRWSGLDRALYMAVNKNDDALYTERVAADPVRAEALVNKARRVIEAQEPPARMSDDPAFWKCKFCDHHAVCHGAALPSVTCRTCMHSTPVTGDGVDAQWHCARWGAVVPLDESRKAQPCHRYIPALLAAWAEVADATDDGDVLYRIGGEYGRYFYNGDGVYAMTEGFRPYSSVELRSADPALIGTPEVEELRARFEGQFVPPVAGEEPVAAGTEEWVDYDDNIPF